MESGIGVLSAHTATLEALDPREPDAGILVGLAAAETLNPRKSQSGPDRLQ